MSLHHWVPILSAIAACVIGTMVAVRAADGVDMPYFANSGGPPDLAGLWQAEDENGAKTGLVTERWFVFVSLDSDGGFLLLHGASERLAAISTQVRQNGSRCEFAPCVTASGG